LTEHASPFAVEVTPDFERFIDCIMRRGTPDRVHYVELFLDVQIKDVICERYGIFPSIDPEDHLSVMKREVAIQRFLGYDYVRCGIDDLIMPLRSSKTDDTAALPKTQGRSYIDEHVGPITNWDEFEQYPWPDPEKISARSCEWYAENLPDDMCIIGGGGFAHFAEYINWLMGYETLCYALYDQRDLVKAIADRLLDLFEHIAELFLAVDRVKIMWGSDDMGFRTGTMISPDDMREFVLPGHKRMAELSHTAGRPYLLHACGNLCQIMDDLIDDVKIDAKHSFEDTIEDVIEDKSLYGDKIALLGGIDVDFLCRASEEDVRERVRRTLEACMPGGGYCLGSGNSVANYIPVDNYLAMMDEGRKFIP